MYIVNFYQKIILMLKFVLIISTILTCTTHVSYADSVPKGEMLPYKPQKFNANLDKQISYYVLQQSIRAAMKDIGTQIGVPILIAPNVKGKVAAGKYKGTARAIFDQISADAGIHWYFDGRAIQVTNVKDAIMHVIKLGGFNFNDLIYTLHLIQIETNNFPIRHDKDNNLVIVYGPPKYVATVEVVAHHLTLRAREKPSVIRG